MNDKKCEIKQKTGNLFSISSCEGFFFSMDFARPAIKEETRMLKTNYEPHTHIHTHHTFLGKSSLPLEELMHGLTVKSFT